MSGVRSKVSQGRVNTEFIVTYVFCMYMHIHIIKTMAEFETYIVLTRTALIQNKFRFDTLPDL